MKLNKETYGHIIRALHNFICLGLPTLTALQSTEQGPKANHRYAQMTLNEEPCRMWSVRMSPGVRAFPKDLYVLLICYVFILPLNLLP